MGLQKGIGCLKNMHSVSYQPYDKMQNKFKKLFKK